jgi:sorting and assembly machinery component 37
VNTVERNGSEPGGRSLNSDFEAAKRDAGIPVADKQANALNMGRGKGVGGLLSSPIYAARFKLDALTNELLDPLSDLLEKKDYLLEGGKPSSLDCLAFGYLALMFYPPVPQAWLKEALQARFPRIVSYINRMREGLLGGDMHLPWRPVTARPLYITVGVAARELTSNLPILSNILQRGVIVQPKAHKPSKQVQSSLMSPLLTNTLLALVTTGTAALAGLAIHHRRNPREGDLIFWALRSQTGGLGEAGDLLKALANGLPPLS